MSTVTQLSPHFTVAEMAVSHAHPTLVRPVPNALIPRLTLLANNGLERVRANLGRPMQILSGYRPEMLNRAVGGSPISQHVVGEAADFTCENIRGAFESIIEMVKRGELKGIGQIIYYPAQGFIHMALASARYWRPTLCVEWPEFGYKYREISADRATFVLAVPRDRDPQARAVA